MSSLGTPHADSDECWSAECSVPQTFKGDEPRERREVDHSRRIRSTHKPRRNEEGHLEPTMRLCAIGVIALLPCVSAVQTQPRARARVETYESATIDATGNLVITTSDRRTIMVPKRSEQSSFARPVASADRTAVGAQAEFPNCCTSYDIPLQLVIYAKGKTHRFKGIGLPIFRWHFVNGGDHVAFGQEPVHAGCSIHYELRDVQSERLIDSADIPQPCAQNQHPEAVKIPNWVADLEADRK